MTKDEVELELRKKSRDIHATFGTDAGKRVLDSHLREICFMDQFCFVRGKDGKLDHDEALLRQGAQAVYKRIKTILSKPPMDDEQHDPKKMEIKKNE